MVAEVADMKVKWQQEAFLCALAGGLLELQAAWLVRVLTEEVAWASSRGQVGCRT